MAATKKRSARAYCACRMVMACRYQRKGNRPLAIYLRPDVSGANLCVTRQHNSVQLYKSFYWYYIPMRYVAGKSYIGLITIERYYFFCLIICRFPSVVGVFFEEVNQLV